LDSRELLHSAFIDINYTLTVKIILYNSITSEILNNNHFHFAHINFSHAQICNSYAKIMVTTGQPDACWYLSILGKGYTNFERCRYGKVHPSTCHEDPKGEWRYSSTLSLISVLEGSG
jgi:hypothetical protein